MSENLPPNLKNAIMLCWAYNWRAMGASFILGSIFAALWGIAARAGQFPAPLVDAGTNAIGIMVVTFCLIFFMHRLMTKGFGLKTKYKIVIEKISDKDHAE